ncbi:MULTISPECIES: type III secretion system export apparatus subunit SctT [unclassified Variovorax]|jgi:type III secretion protein T|uniref:type III secretion system export apparatus subunit SctT n=1 Tax=unclassified Variovorax TaxID=663243 RepID=UPI0008D1FD67|nr:MULTISPECIES: type III secretion system export apparatus subunit SctT [unclassified Variovorax]SEK10068.1 type III secretion protein T [Variovorax sp. OK202]SFD66150.1 type III secretion protein T [Variovorax sp. OK212]
MTGEVTYADIKNFVSALALTQPRILAMFIVLPIFNQQLMPGLLRYAVAGALGAVAVPFVMPEIAQADFNAPQLVMLILKEAFIGFVLGYLAAIPFWIFEAVGFLIDNQRGASIAATLNPLTGNDSSPMGILFNQAFIVYFLLAGGFSLLLGTLYDSFKVWSIVHWAPALNADAMPLMLAQLDRLGRLAFLFAGPVLVAMFLSEVGLALVSRFAPQLQVFFMAMPIKSALAVLVLILYGSLLFDYGADQIEGIGRILPFLQDLWGGAVEGAVR